MKLFDQPIALYVGNKIKTHRKRLKLTQQDLGKILFVQNNSISAYERGVVIPTIEQLHILAELFQIPVNEFFPEYNLVDIQLDTSGLDGEDVELLNKIIRSISDIDKDLKKDFLEKIDFLIQLYKQKGK